MIWTEITRSKYRRDGLQYARDTSDEEWVVIAPLLPVASKGGRRRTTAFRDAVDAIFYIVRISLMVSGDFT